MAFPQVNISNLRTVKDRPVVFKQILSATNENSERQDWRGRLNDLNSYLQARAAFQAGTSEPSPFVGQIWANTSNAGRTLFMGAADVSGHRDQVLTKAEAWRLAMAVPPATLSSPTIGLSGQFFPANTTSRQTIGNKMISDTGGGYYRFLAVSQGMALTHTFRYYLNGTAALVLAAGAVTNPAGFGKAWHFSIAALSQKAFSVNRIGQDDIGNTKLTGLAATVVNFQSALPTTGLTIGVGAIPESNNALITGEFVP